MQLRTFIALLFAATLSCRAESPFGVAPTVTDHQLRIDFAVPAKHFLYADKLSAKLDGQLVTLTLPATVEIEDKFSGEKKRVFQQSFVATCPLNGAKTLSVHLQGCDDANCYFPEERVFTLSAGKLVRQDDEPSDSGKWQALTKDFDVTARGSGYLNERDFLAFLAGVKASAPTGLWAGFALILLGGLGLNLTPCVLPLIPINLSIIGAGAQASSRCRGFALGAVYGAGMAAAYGALGAAVVLTGAKFGTLNSSPWFNLGIAGIFVALALCMFDVFALDFSRFMPRGGESRGKFLAAGTMGALAALLAGACVAPVVISVLVQATSLYNRGVALGLALPFVLGLGMGLPWPLAGAGLSFLPKPGRWMNRVKYGFGVAILVLAGYYGWLGFGQLRPSRAEQVVTETSDDLSAALARAKAEGKPVFVDFWASWCKDCSAMEHTTFRAAAVQAKLNDYIVVRVQAEQPNQPPAKELLDHFGAMGLPTYVVLTPKTKG
jgi:thioredoxin:protein disulfide reductase